MWMWLGQHCSVIKFYDDKYYGTDKLIWHYINVVLKNYHYHVQFNSYWGFSASKRSTAKPCIQVLPSTMPRTLVIRCQCLWMGNWGHKKPCETQMVDNHWYKEPLTTQVFTQSEAMKLKTYSFLMHIEALYRTLADIATPGSGFPT